MKKTLSLIVAAVMLALTFAGCSSEDMELYSAVMKQPESSVTTTSLSYDIQIEEQFSQDGYEYMAENYFAKALSELLSLPEIVSVVTKNGNDIRRDITISTEDSMNKLTLWSSTDPADPIKTEATILIPSYVRPFLPLNMKGKRYATFDVREYMQAVTGFGVGDMGIIGGADGLTSVFVAPMASELIANDKLIEQAAKLLDVKLVSDVSKQGENKVYTVKLNSRNLSGVVDGIVKSLSKKEVGNIIGAIAVMSGGAQSSSEISKAVEEGAAYADTIDELVCEKIAQTGLLDNGVTVKYTVNKDGYVVKTETDIRLDVDDNKIYKAVAELMTELAGEQFDEMDIKGKLKLEVKCVRDVARINEKLDTMKPVLTNENNINLAKDIADYSEYTRAESEWYQKWDNYWDKENYLSSLEDGQTLVLRNSRTGKEITGVPKNINGELCVPAAQLIGLFGDMSISWNSELMGVEIKRGESTTLYLNGDGVTMFYDALGEADYDETIYASYDDVIAYYSSNFDENGIFYVEVDEFNYSWMNEYKQYYKARFEDGKYCFVPYEDIEFKYHKSMNGNLFYELAKIFG